MFISVNSLYAYFAVLFWRSVHNGIHNVQETILLGQDVIYISKFLPSMYFASISLVSVTYVGMYFNILIL